MIGFTICVSLNYCQFVWVLLERGVWDFIIYLFLIVAYRFTFVHVYANTPEPRTCTLLLPISARNNPTETPSAKVTIFRNTNTQLPLKPFCNFQGVI